jgi:microcystin-dependent protein
MDEIMGTVKLFAGPYEVRGFMFCDGRRLSISNYTALFSIIGTIYGGDGVATFEIPDLKDKAPEGMHYMICVEGLYPSRY